MSIEGVSGLFALARDWSHALDADGAERVALYVRRLLEWNRRVNLTGANTFADILAEHLPDSFVISRLVPADSTVVDVGAGGGLPGIPFAILRPDCRITLLEPRAKRVAFLNTAVRDCGCGNAVVLRGRLDDASSRQFAMAVSRATFPPDEWLELAPSLLAPSGCAIVLATDAVRPRTIDARLVDSLEYTVGNGARRWAGSYCFT